MEKDAWELHERQMKEQYIMAISDKDQQLNHLQSLLRASSQTEILSTQSQRQVSISIWFAVQGALPKKQQPPLTVHLQLLGKPPPDFLGVGHDFF